MIEIEYKTIKELNNIISEQTEIGNVPHESWTIEGVNTIYFYTRDEWLDNVIRPERDELLKKTDKFMLADYVETLKTSGDYDTIKAYRQALRDLPEIVNPQDVVFPILNITGE